MEIQWEKGDAATLAAVPSISVRQQLLSVELSVPIDISLPVPCWLPALLVCHLWHLCSTQRPRLYAAPKMGISSTEVETGSARHTLNQVLTEATSSPSRHSRQQQQQYPSQAPGGGLIDSTIAGETERKR